MDVWDSGNTHYHREYLEHLAQLDRTERDLHVATEWARRQEEQAAAVLAGTELELARLLDEADEFEQQRQDRRRSRELRRPWHRSSPRPDRMDSDDDSS